MDMLVSAAQVRFDEAHDRIIFSLGGVGMISGSIVALVTPMDEQGNLDQAALERLVEFHVENGTDGIVAVGTTGESATLDVEEHCEVVRQVVRLAGGRISVIAGTGANSTREAITLTSRSAELGVDACLLVTPYYNKPTQEGLYLHYRAVAEAVDIPQILYNVPGRTACDMADETAIRLAEIPNIVGLKDATADLQRAAWLVAHRPDGFALYSGDDASAMEFVLAGGDGVISVTANVAPAAMHEMIAAARNGDRQGAESINQALEALHRDLFVEANPIPVKWAVQQMGLMKGGIRLPLTVLSDQYHRCVNDAMARAGAL